MLFCICVCFWTNGSFGMLISGDVCLWIPFCPNAHSLESFFAFCFPHTTVCHFRWSPSKGKANNPAEENISFHLVVESHCRGKVAITNIIFDTALQPLHEKHIWLIYHFEQHKIWLKGDGKSHHFVASIWGKCVTKPFHSFSEVYFNDISEIEARWDQIWDPCTHIERFAHLISLYYLTNLGTKFD